MVLDPAAVQQLRALDSESGGGLVAELLELFEKGTPERVQRMREALASGDAKVVEREAHSLKGSCGALGAVELLELCAELERLARRGDLSDAPARIDGIEASFAAVRLEMIAAYGGKG
jgi:HPt (histidine-containing phosphotransfer) domain-containing protein